MKLLSKFLMVIAVSALAAFVWALPTMWLWNWIMPAVFGVIKIGFWKALGMNLLAGMLFKSNLSFSKRDEE